MHHSGKLRIGLAVTLAVIYWALFLWRLIYP